MGDVWEFRSSACSAAANSSAALLWFPQRSAARAKSANLCAISTRRIGRHPRGNPRFNDDYDRHPAMLISTEPRQPQHYPSHVATSHGARGASLTTIELVRHAL
jgi:hypothetical protein